MIWCLISGNVCGLIKIVEIVNVLGVNLEWLFIGIGFMKKDGIILINVFLFLNIFKIDILDFEVSVGSGVIN